MHCTRTATIVKTTATRFCNRTKVENLHTHLYNHHERYLIKNSLLRSIDEDFGKDKNVYYAEHNIASTSIVGHDQKKQMRTKSSCGTRNMFFGNEFSNTIALHRQRAISMRSSTFIHNSKYYFSTRKEKDMNSGIWEQPFDTNSKRSSRSLFKAIPIDPSILAHIRSIGLGMRPKGKRKPRKMKRKTGKDFGDGILSEDDEMSFFSTREGTRRKNLKRPSTTSESNDESDQRGNFLPPPPFSSNEASRKQEFETHVTESDCSIERLPVKVLGRVGSLKDEMPRSSKGLPEIAIVGRSNVGKSTLLNALLYGNQFESNHTEDKKYIRGKTPSGAKIGKGVKAKVSKKPGETKHISFYQLTSKVAISNQKPALTSHDVGRTKIKLSLVLVDLPGYGFAYANEERSRDWKELMEAYILHRGKSMKRMLLLIDARHGLKKTDFEFLASLQDGMNEKHRFSNISLKSETGKIRKNLPPIQIVLTKCDLVTQNDLARRVVQVKSQLSSVLRREPSELPVMLVSAVAGLGFNNLRNNRARGGILELQKELASVVPNTGYIVS